MPTFEDKQIMLEQAKKNPEDLTLLGALADVVEELGDPDLANMLRNRPHTWDDVSYHGSPDYECTWCGAQKWRKSHTDVCPKCVPHILRVIAERELKERGELRRFLEEDRRKQHLLDKYGDIL
jgi:hypothetical protein